MKVTVYYREKEAEYDFMDGGHYHTDDAVWIMEKYRDDRGTEWVSGCKKWIQPIHAIDFDDPGAGMRTTKITHYEDPYTITLQDFEDIIDRNHLLEITKAEAFELLL
ncbi:MAG: hypothetical protein JSV32_06460 [Dehalococcoidia bacterium]|nr:MAG: hypothetical protein JSV32_06460 [Dehalococcoidia bacterium]